MQKFIARAVSEAYWNSLSSLGLLTPPSSPRARGKGDAKCPRAPSKSNKRVVVMIAVNDENESALNRSPSRPTCSSHGPGTALGVRLF